MFMKKFAVAILLSSALIGFGVARSQTPAAKGSGAVAELKQAEHDWADAEKANDTDKLSQLIADDWKAIGPDGVKLTKAEFIDGYKSGKTKTESFEFGAMDVKVIGSVGIVQGTDTEKSSYNGKDSSGKYTWTDVFAKRDGKWVVVRSQLALLK
jgi:ketosteroid isomerase-like protein